jgi:hypothetical protein
MITFQVEIEMDEESWKDHVLGSGATKWEWWHDIYQNSSGDVIIDHWYDEDNEEYIEESRYTPFRHYTTLQKIADAASALAAEDKFVCNQLVGDDFDADGMDRVLQYVAFGDVIFG